MPKYDPKVIEEKWQRITEERKPYEPDIDTSKDKVLITVPVIYPTGTLHLGHLYTWTRADMYARFMRMRGFNVLFPQAFHMTGGPMVGLSLRLKNGEEKAVRMMKDQKVSDEDIKKFSEDPVALGLYFSDSYKNEFTKAGISIDWRRLFILSYTPQYSKFLEWQFNTLKKKGLIVQGTHPVIWCPKEETPLGDHDRLSGEGESPEAFSIIKFTVDGYVLPAGTLRPETIFGVSNLWLNSEVKYKKLTMEDGEEWITSEQFSKKIGYMLKNVVKEESFDVHRLIGKNAKNPVDNQAVPIFDAEFVDGDVMTGVVMSVPMHAPFDYYYLHKSNLLEKLPKKPVRVIEVENEDGIVEASIKKFGDGKEGLDEATKYVYKKELSSGLMNSNAGKFANVSVDMARTDVSTMLEGMKVLETMYEPSGEVTCRCGAKGVVKLLENQWFIHYSDRELKDKMISLVEKMNVFPEEVRTQFATAISNLEDKAAARHGGLGTPLPWDKEWLIEPLSDSTIYMAYYTIASIANKMDANELNDDLFDYVFLGEKRADASYPEEAEDMRKEFQYWYPVDMRVTARELLTNHMVFFIANHVAIFTPDNWPKSISINGWLTVNKQKMSKSKGNTYGISDFVERYGADPVRLIGTASDGLDDAEWSTNNTNSVYQKIETLMDLTEILSDFRSESGIVDDYAKSKLNGIIKTATEAYSNMRFRTAVQSSLFESMQLLKEYLDFGGKNGDTLREMILTIIRLNHPVFPFVTEEINSILDGKDMLETYRSWPDFDESSARDVIESEFSVVKNTIDDIRNLIKMLKIKPKEIRVGIAKKDSFELYNKIVSEVKTTRDVNEIRKRVRSNSKIVDKLLKNKSRLPENKLDSDTEMNAFEQAKEYIARIFECEVRIESSEDEKAIPGKPALKIA